ncbi:DNA helicase [Marasmius sp. AFHP31]|nr:DNA helicase [Marasmius sp. AFHP31]
MSLKHVQASQRVTLLVSIFNRSLDAKQQDSSPSKNLRRVREDEDAPARRPPIIRGMYNVAGLQRREELPNGVRAPASLILRKDAQVMLTKNLDEEFLCGSMGIVAGFRDPTAHGPGEDSDTSQDGGTRYPVVEFATGHQGTQRMIIHPESFKVQSSTGEILASRTQIKPDPKVVEWSSSL